MMETNRIIYTGSYTSAKDRGIHAFRIFRKSGDISVNAEEIFNVGGVSNPSYLAVSRNGLFVYAVQEDMTYNGAEGGGIAAFKKEGDTLILLNTKGTIGTLPCHLLLDEKRKYLYTANYMSGSISMFSLGEDGSIIDMCDFRQHSGHGQNPDRQDGPHVHFIGHSSDEKGIWCVDLGLDTIYYYQINEKNSTLIPDKERNIHLPGGTGPRHFVLAGEHKEFMYVVCELSSEVFVVDCSEKKTRIVQRISTLDRCRMDSTCAAIHISTDGRFLYASNRGDDSIAVFAINDDNLLDRVEITKTEGINPRDFWLGDGILLAANQDSDSITIFDVDKSTGKILYTGKMLSCHKPVCLVS